MILILCSVAQPGNLRLEFYRAVVYLKNQLCQGKQIVPVCI